MFIYMFIFYINKHMTVIELNNIVIKLLKSLSKNETYTSDEITTKWNKYLIDYKNTNQSRKGKRTVYAIFADEIRKQLSDQDPPVISRNIVMKTISERWKQLKNNDVEYGNYKQLHQSNEH